MGKRSNAVKAFAAIDAERAKDLEKKVLPSKLFMRSMIRAHYDFQANRTIVANRLKMTADGEPQEGFEDYVRSIPQPAYETLKSSLLALAGEEDNARENIEDWVNAQSFYKEWLINVKGCGPLMSAIILTEFDIQKADTVSKLWAYAGVSPGLTHGIKMVEAKDDKGKAIKDEVTGKAKKIPQVDEDSFVRQDCLTAGFIAPYNKFLKTKLLGVLAASFLRTGNGRYRMFYENMKNREMSKIGTKQQGKDGKEYDFYLGWAHNRALRYMVKMFLQDLYVAWRTHENLPVRAPYQEQYLGHKHQE